LFVTIKECRILTGARAVVGKPRKSSGGFVGQSEPAQKTFNIRTFDEYVFMRTTLDIPDEVFKKAKLKAVEEGVSLKAIIVRAIEQEVGVLPNRVRARTKRANRLFAVLDKAKNTRPVGRLKRDELYDRAQLIRHSG
jgi:hypothetical protein